MKYSKRRSQYEASNLTFNPDTGLGYSYAWYEITKRIKGKLYLNTYPFSHTTQRHVYKLRRLLDSLGLEYREIEAPNGLQNLDAAIEHCLYRYAECVVTSRYARNPAARPGDAYQAMTIQLRKLGAKTDLAYAGMVERAEQNRRLKLDAKRRRQAARKAKEAPLLDNVTPLSGAV